MHETLILIGDFKEIHDIIYHMEVSLKQCFATVKYMDTIKIYFIDIEKKIMETCLKRCKK